MPGAALDREESGVGSPDPTTDGARAKEAALRTLRHCKLFASVPTQELLTILALGRERRIARRATVFRQGDRAESVYVMIGGRVKLLLTGPSGRVIVLDFVEPGGTFGYLAPMAGTARAHTAQAVEESRVLAWPAETFEEILRRYPRVARSTLRLIARQVQADWSRLHDLATEPVARRMARTILRLARAGGLRKASALTMKQQDLAELLGTTPPTLSRILGRWESRGLVTAGRERMVVVHPEGLARIAESDELIGRTILRHSRGVPAKSLSRGRGA